MRRAPACATAVALLLAAPAAAGLPSAGELVPGRSLGGVRLGEPAAQVRAALGSFYGVCHGCATRTWYFTYKRFDDRGLGVELTRGRVSAVYTLWQPPGWHDVHGLTVNATEPQVTKLAGPLVPVTCSGYDALFRDDHGVRSVYYFVDQKLWGFGLMTPPASPCR